MCEKTRVRFKKHQQVRFFFYLTKRIYDKSELGLKLRENKNKHRLRQICYQSILHEKKTHRKKKGIANI